MVILTRKEAKRLKLNRYYTGKMCKQGHTVERIVSSGGCVSCKNIANSKWAKDNPEKATAISNTWIKRNPEKAVECNRLAGIKYRKENRIAKNQAQYAYAKANPGKVNARTAKRRAALLKATPLWANKQAMEAIYINAVQISHKTGISHEVDHVIPLRGKNVSGLHIESNLQILEMHDNRVKSNKFKEA